MGKIKKIAYSFMIGDLFNYGHLKVLELAKKNTDYHICGVISDNIAQNWTSPLICTYEERKEVIEKIIYVDEVYMQDSMDPTKNLEQIHEKYPDAKIYLIQSHHLWGSPLGTDYIKQIKGEVITHDFYPSLSRDYMIKTFYNFFVEKKIFNNFVFNDLKIGDINYFQKQFSTKANTLGNLKALLKNAMIEKEFIFTAEEWEKEENQITSHITGLFENNRIVIRSSSLNEDSLEYSNAGFYESLLNIDSKNDTEIKNAVNKVLESYKKGYNFSKQNQILVQKQTEDAIISGVIFTRNLWSNTPYYLINYDDISNKTDTVTSGMGSKKLEILRDVLIKNIDKKWQNLIIAVREIESFFIGTTLDIEFAIKENGTIVIFQARPLAANSKFYSLDDNFIVKNIEKCKQKYLNLITKTKILSDELSLSDMAFWNPSELIGDRPNYLDYSLFNHLIMKSNWNEALVLLGYTEVNDNLLILIGNKPYINIHHAFLSLLPDKIPIELKKKLLNFYNKQLKNNPELHDKIEFEIVHNCYRFDFDTKSNELLKNGFSLEEIVLLKNSLIDLTNNIINKFFDIVKQNDESIKQLEDKFNDINKKKNNISDWQQKLNLIFELIEDCKQFGINPFCRLARLAFIGKAILTNLKDSDIISSKDYDEFMNSICTIATEMNNDFFQLINNKLSFDDFINKYGHLRPGTYDITKLPYKKMFQFNQSMHSSQVSIPFEKESIGYLKDNIITKITEICRTHKIKADGCSLIEFIKKSIQLRELYKFIYTKNISLALELIAEIGEEFGFNRDEMSNLDYYSIINNRLNCNKEELINIWKNLITSRKEEARLNSLLSLPSIIFSKEDFVVVQFYMTKPNFITDLIVQGEIVILEKEKEVVDINNKIIVIEKADPGYDWIFTKKIKALITKYGGAASHMAIRCAEFNIPAAIGCGDIIFSKILKSNKIVLDCKNKTINNL